MKPVTAQMLNPHNYPTDSEQHVNLDILLHRLNVLSEACNMEFQINSGLRSGADQARINPKAPHSKHLIGAAADVNDPHKLIFSWCMNNMAVVEAIGLWMEDPINTPTWTHFQCQPPKSGSRVFIA